MVRAYSKNLGLITINARGASRKNSKIAKFFNEFTVSKLDLKKSKNYYYVQDGEVINSNFSLSKNPRAVVLASFFAEIILRSIYDEEENEFIFHLLEKSIEAVNYNFSKLIFLSFSIKFLAVSGFKKDFSCKICGERKDLYYSLVENLFYCEKDKDKARNVKLYKINNLELKVINTILHRKISQAKNYEKYLKEEEIRYLNSIFLKILLVEFELNTLNSINWLKKYEFIL